MLHFQEAPHHVSFSLVTNLVGVSPITSIAREKVIAKLTFHLAFARGHVTFRKGIWQSSLLETT